MGSLRVRSDQQESWIRYVSVGSAPLCCRVLSWLGLVVKAFAGKRKDAGSVSRLGPVVRRSVGKRKDAGSVSRLGLVVKALGW